MELEKLKDLYIHELKDLYSAEKQIIKALPKMVKAATNKQLAAGFKGISNRPRSTLVRWKNFSIVIDESDRRPEMRRHGRRVLGKDEMIEEDAEDEVRMPDWLVRRRARNARDRRLRLRSHTPNCSAIGRVRSCLRSP